jgi:predicted metalloprotease
MRWTPEGRSADVEDRRGEDGGGGGGGFRLGGGGMGIGGFIVLLLLSFIFKRNFFALVGGGGGPSGPPAAHGTPPPATPEEEKMIDFVSVVLDDVQNTWQKELAQSNIPYHRAKLDIFTNRVRSGCGVAEEAMGPFYCPVDQKAYIDLGFYKELKDRFGAPGEFAQAYVLAHEIGHHVQHELGIDQKVRQAQEQDSSQARPLSVRLELQADCFAGIWAHSVKQRSSDTKSPIAIDDGDVESALNAAAAVGDDRIQKQSTGSVNPETWTHGSSQQRMQWFRTGLDTGDINRCDTFASR